MDGEQIQVSPAFEQDGVRLFCGDARSIPLPDGCVQTCITSPPYFGLRDYQVDGQIGLEQTPDEYVAALVDVFREVRRVLADDGTLWLNIGSSYAGSCMTGGNNGINMDGGPGGFKMLRQFKKAAKIGTALDLDGCQPFALRDGLTVDETVYILSELAAHLRQSNEVPEPHGAVGVDQAIASLADGEKV